MKFLANLKGKIFLEDLLQELRSVKSDIKMEINGDL